MTRPPAVLAQVWRSGMLEGTHHGHAVVVGPDGAVRASWGDADAVVLPRSALKPLQAAALLRCGLDLSGELLALAAASHAGEEYHLQGARRILASAGLGEADLQTPPDWPYDPVERDAWVAAGRGPAPVAMNCSGKHAAMLATCVLRGWDTATYLDPDHPVQRAIRDEIEQRSGEPVSGVGVDGCGAPLFAVTLAGLARAVSACASADPGTPPRRVADAMRTHPEWVGGSRLDVTALMRGIPGLLAKNGAEAVHVAALPDGTAVALKVLDGSDRARAPVMAALLRGLGVEAAVLDEQAEHRLLGGGRPVGAVRAAATLAEA